MVVEIVEVVVVAVVVGVDSGIPDSGIPDLDTHRLQELAALPEFQQACT